MRMNIQQTPWLTPKAIGFLEIFLKAKRRKILEFGSGASTIWFSKFNANIVSIDHDDKWHNGVKNELVKQQKSNVDLRIRPRPYNTVCEDFPDRTFDLVLVDGRDRILCVRSAMSKVKKGGILMLDNAERIEYAEVYKILADWKLVEFIYNTKDSAGCIRLGSFVYESLVEWKTNCWTRLK